MVCPTCGANQPDGAKFCNQCGAQLPAMTVVINLTCATCGHVNPSGSKFCGECGAQLETMSMPAPAPAPAPAPVVSMRLVSHNGTAIHLGPNASNTWLIGREDPVNNIHPDVDLTPYDATQSVSRRHAQLVLSPDGQPRLVSIATTNWTKVNDLRVAPNQPVQLRPGDRIELGQCRLVFEM